MNSSPIETQKPPLPPPSRSRFEGMLNVVRFNWPLYVVGSTVAIAAALIALLVPLTSWLRIAMAIGACAAIYLIASSLIISHWVYDLTPIFRLAAARHAAGAGRILNIHTGFDESSPALRAQLPGADFYIFELHDPARMTEPSIARARRYQHRTAPPWLAELTQRVDPSNLPSPDSSIDTIFAILAIHEIRIPQGRQKLFAELTRILRPAGRLILIEHLRDFPNFLAFGPQFVHFYSRSTWLNLGASAGLTLIHEESITPFLGLFVFEKNRDAARFPPQP